MDVKQKVSMLDDIFSAYLLNQNEKVFCRDTATVLNAFSQKEFTINIIDESNENESFFGMRVFPDENHMVALCGDITNGKDVASISAMLKRWRNIKSWVIEIDSRSFDRMKINFNPSELTAMLLHEIGHTVYSDRKVEMFSRVYKECNIRMKTADKAASKVLYFLYQIPLTVLCGFRNWEVTSTDLKEEIFADTSVQKLGYGEHLISAFEKIIKKCGNTTGYSSKMEDSIEQSITWCNLNVADLEKRQQKLKDELYLTGRRTNSTFIHKVIKGIMDRLHIRKKERYTGNIVIESSINIDFADSTFYRNNELMYDFSKFNKLKNSIRMMKDSANSTIAQEAFFKKNKKNEIPSQLDVDTIFVEIDRIENHADRRYVLDLIYHQEEKIENFKEKFAYNRDLERKHGAHMENMLKELESMRRTVLAKRNFDKDYKVFVKYPAGYEG